MDLPTSLFTTQSLLSFSGAVIAATLVPNVLATVATLSPRLLRLISLIVAVALALLMAYWAQDTNWIKWLVAFFNGLLIYLSALGANETLARTGGERAPQSSPTSVRAQTETALGSAENRKFFSSWF